MTMMSWVKVALLLLVHYTTAFRHDAWRDGVKPLFKARIDYRLANKYMAENYGHQTRQPYFTASQAKQTIWNGRNGVYDDFTGLWKPASLDSCGFCLQQQTQETTPPSLKELKNAIKKSFPNDSISDTVFWYPKIDEVHRLLDNGLVSDIRPLAALAGVPRVDMDLGGYINVESILKDKNFVGDANTSDLTDKLKNGRRFAIVKVALPSNDHGNVALLATRYGKRHAAFPTAVPNALSRWYSFPNLTQNEILLCYQYDRLLQQPSDVWHCVLEKESHHRGNSDAQGNSRCSFDLQCMVVFDETLSPEQDRFGKDRIRQLRGPWE